MFDDIVFLPRSTTTSLPWLVRHTKIGVTKPSTTMLRSDWIPTRQQSWQCLETDAADDLSSARDISWSVTQALETMHPLPRLFRPIGYIKINTRGGCIVSSACDQWWCQVSSRVRVPVIDQQRTCVNVAGVRRTLTDSIHYTITKTDWRIHNAP